MSLETRPVTVNLGPQHPSTHGVFRMRVTFDGEEIVDVEPVFGYLHRGSEKLAEERTYSQIVTLTAEDVLVTRLDDCVGRSNKASCRAVGWSNSSVDGSRLPPPSRRCSSSIN